jgi:hypothetical protein
MFRYNIERSITQMRFNTLQQVRQQMYGCFGRSADALFNLSDALLSESQARSLPELSLSVFFQRRWPSVYEALQDGRINVERLREVFVETLLAERPSDEPIWLGLDSSRRRRLYGTPNLRNYTDPVR